MLKAPIFALLYYSDLLSGLTLIPKVMKYCIVIKNRPNIAQGHGGYYDNLDIHYTSAEQ